MTEQRGRSLPESHLLPDAVVAFVDAELSLGAHERAATHLAHCPGCAAEVAAQRQARKAVRGAQAPAMSAGFLASLRSIPDDTEINDLPGAPDNLAVTDDGQLVAVQRPEKLAGTAGQSTPLGGTAPLGQSGKVIGGGSHPLRRRTAQGAGVVVSGAVLGAIALGMTGGLGTDVPGDRGGTAPAPPAPDVLRAQFNVPTPSAPGSTSSGVPSTASSSTASPSTASSTDPPRPLPAQPR